MLSSCPSLPTFSDTNRACVCPLHAHKLWAQYHLCHCDQWKTKTSPSGTGVTERSRREKSTKHLQTKMTLLWRGSEEQRINCLSAVLPVGLAFPKHLTLGTCQFPISVIPGPQLLEKSYLRQEWKSPLGQVEEYHMLHMQEH